MGWKVGIARFYQKPLLRGFWYLPIWCRLKEHVKSHKHEGEKLSLPRHLKVVGQIEHLVITLGSLRLDCPAAVVGE